MANRFARALPLNDATLAAHGRRAELPRYDRHALTPAVAHISVGAFHRSHQAVYFDDLARLGVKTWGVTGIGLHRPEMQEAMAAQDGLYTVVARGSSRDHARVVGVMSRYLFAPQDGRAVLDTLGASATRVVTLTVTGAAYKVDPGTGQFQDDDPEVAMDLADPDEPISALGYLVEGLDRRRRAGLPPFTVLSCDNVPRNGELARRALVSFAALRDPGLARWIDEHGAFPSSMVDRITPQTTDADRAFVAREFGIADRWPVITEPFSQWIIEDEFSDGRPPLDLVGAQFVSDVRPYSLMKTRLLNASHCAIGFLGSLAGHRRIDEAMADPVFAAYLERLMRDEVAPLLPAVPGVDLVAYRRTLLRRFANPKIGDSLDRLARAGSAKMPVHVLSSIREARARGRDHTLLTLAVAGWLRSLHGIDDAGRPLHMEDPLGERLQALAAVGGTDPRPLLSQRKLFGQLGADPAFADELGRALVAMERFGARDAIEEALRSDQPLRA